MRVRIPTPLRSYTGGRANVEADGTTVDAVLSDLDRRFPGIRFRIVDEQRRLRRHMTIWVDGERCRDLDASVAGVLRLEVSLTRTDGGRNRGTAVLGDVTATGSQADLDTLRTR